MYKRQGLGVGFGVFVGVVVGVAVGVVVALGDGLGVGLGVLVGVGSIVGEGKASCVAARAACTPFSIASSDGLQATVRHATSRMMNATMVICRNMVFSW